ncbi:hypothetical protein B0H11DRAFT_573267 [Mycena galericulata]|nr:hypothetical protein B0H11DRAFT_573267 [Mycena galericulata]
MHRCLTILEIVEMICSELDPSRYVDSAALAVLARTCRMFHDPALDNLWATQKSLLNILGCMPLDLLSPHPTLSDGKMVLPRPVIATDWERALLYSRRVKRFEPDLATSSYWSKILPALNAYLPGGCWFPNLTSLRWRFGEGLPAIDVFLTPRIRDLKFTCHSSKFDVSSVLYLADKCDGVKRLDIWMSGPSYDRLTVASLSVSTFVERFRRLERLAVEGVPLTIAALKAIGKLPKLVSLLLTALPHDLASSPDLEGPSFTNLDTLRLAEMHSGPVTKFLRLCVGASLDILVVGMSTQETMSMTAIRDLAGALASFGDSITSLTLDEFGADIPTASGDSLNDDIIRPLFCFRNLTQIRIYTFGGVDISDEAVEQMAQSWPNIILLELETYAGVDLSWTCPRNTLAGLISIAKYCTSLRRLSLAVDASIVPPSSLHHARKISQRALTEMNVNYSPISDPVAVARFLHSIFPSLYLVDADNDYWVQVEDDEGNAGLCYRWLEVESRLRRCPRPKKKNIEESDDESDGSESNDHESSDEEVESTSGDSCADGNRV